jgi:hypothetical protein
VQIVHSLQYGPVKDGIGSASIQLPNGYNKTEWELIAFVQNADNGKISAVAPII